MSITKAEANEIRTLRKTWVDTDNERQALKVQLAAMTDAKNKAVEALKESTKIGDMNETEAMVFCKKRRALIAELEVI